MSLKNIIIHIFLGAIEYTVSIDTYWYYDFEKTSVWN